MMTERRYKDDEVRRIFEIAAKQKGTGFSSPAAVEGLTLAEMQSVALEVGIEPGAVARAADALSAPPARPLRKSMGIPIEVRQTVAIPRPMTDPEWEQVVTELRSTFQATPDSILLGAIAGATYGVNALSVGHWRRERTRQMNYVAERIATIMGREHV